MVVSNIKLWWSCGEDVVIFNNRFVQFVVISWAGTCGDICSDIYCGNICGDIYSEFYHTKHYKYKVISHTKHHKYTVIFTTIIKSHIQYLLAIPSCKTLQIYEGQNQLKHFQLMALVPMVQEVQEQKVNAPSLTTSHDDEILRKQWSRLV